jgi:hypothetical protein
MSSLIELNTEYKEIMKAIELNEGEINEEIELALTKNLIESKDKISGYVMLLDRFENEIEFVNNKIKKAKEYITKIAKHKDRLESIALKVIEAKGEKLEGNNGNWINKRKSVSLEIIDEDKIPAIYSKIEVKIDKAAVKEAILKRGEQIEGCVIRENTSLQWK